MSHTVTARREQLYQALVAFSRTPRFFLFKGVQAGRLMPEGCGPLGTLGELTFEQLLDQMQSSAELAPSTTAEQEEGLFHLLQVLGEDAGEAAQLAADDDISILVPDSFGTVDIPTLDEELKRQTPVTGEDIPDDVPVGSVPLELALRAILSKIASHPAYDTVRKRTIGEFWDAQWMSAPFEEAMSIEQFVGLDLAVLFKKRMVTDTRIQSILRALRRALSLLEGDAPEMLSTRADSLPPSAQTDVQTTANTALDATKKVPLHLPKRAPEQRGHRAHHALPRSPGVAAVWEIMERAGAEQTLVYALRERFSPTECAAIVLADTVSSTSQRDLEIIVANTVAERSLDLVRTLLCAPTVRLDHITTALFGADAEPTALSDIIAAVVARALGAVPVSIDGAVCDGLWTRHPEALQALVRRRCGRRGRVRWDIFGADMQSQVDPFLLKFIQAHGRGQGSRTEPRNRLKHRRRKGK